MSKSKQPSAPHPTGSGKASNAGTPQLTFGIELEFHAVHDKQWSTLVQAGHDYFREMVVKALDGSGIRVDTEFSDMTYTTPNKLNHGLWKLEMESLDESEAEAALICEGVDENENLELISRVFGYKQDEWQNEIAQVLSVLHSTASGGCVLLTNFSTGFHVHVGYGSSGVPLRTAKTVLQISLAFERLFDMLYTTSRIAHYPEVQSNHFNAPLSRTLAETDSTDDSRNLFYWLSVIEACDTVLELCDIYRYRLPSAEGPRVLRHGHHSVLNFENLVCRDAEDDENYRKPMGTIEFRQHAGTLDAATVYAHVEICRALVEYSGRATDVQILQLLARAGRKEDDFDIFALLTHIGTEPSAIAFHRYCLSDANQRARQAQLVADIATLNNYHIPRLERLKAQTDIETFAREDRREVEKVIRAKQEREHYGLVTPVNPAATLPREGRLPSMYQRSSAGRVRGGGLEEW